ncbi:MAG TPA: alpha/beta hydrolase [Steroidobacteraceae bacterium]|nr:alpha/beta hydrolase [Steroidobacteraceae bacterium]
MTHPTVSLLLALGLLAAADGAQASASLVLSPCELQDPLQVHSVTAECGTLSVPENPQDPQGRHISLHVARVSAISRRKRPDPLFVFAGGPGMAATAFYASASFAFDWIHRERDIVLVDQRGTGDSNPLTCALDDTELYRASDAQIAAQTQLCLASLKPKARVEFYTTSIAVKDLDAVRGALGYESINLYGVSYGTRIAQHYLRRYPDRVRSVILDGVVPPQIALGPAMAGNAEAALRSILARCASDAGCHAQFGDPLLSYQSLHSSLQARSVPVDLFDPTSGQRVRFEFSPYHFAAVLRLVTYTSEQAALLPLILHRAAQSGDFTPLAAQFLLVTREVRDAIAYGMHNSIVCSEDVPFYDLAAVNISEMQKTFLGTTQLEGLRNICRIWPRGPIDPDFHSALHTDRPVLLLSGGADPVTPPRDAELARQGFTHSLHVVLKGFGHGQLTAPCVGKLMASFLDAGGTAGVDASCTQADRPMPFFTSLGGPSP